MTEEITYNRLGEREVTFHWNGEWYTFPFFLFEDWCHEWGNNRYMKKYSKVSVPEVELGPDQELRAWMKSVDPENSAAHSKINPLSFEIADLIAEQHALDAEAIPKLKEIMKNLMPAMSAYKLYITDELG